MGPVRVVGQDRPPGRGARRRDGPVVGADGVGRDVLGVGDHLTGGELDAFGGQPVVGQHAGGDRAGIQTVGDRQIVGGLQLPVQGVGLQPGGTGDLRPLDLGGGVAGQAMAADADHLVRAPEVGGGPGDLEFLGQGPRAGPDLAHIGVDPGGEGLGIALGLGPIGGPFGGHVAAIEEEPGGPVLGGEVRAEVLGQQAQPPLAPQVDLPQPIAGDIVALQEEGVADAGGIDVGDAPLVDQNFRRRFKARDLMAGARRLSRCGARPTGEGEADENPPHRSSQILRHEPRSLPVSFRWGQLSGSRRSWQ